MKRRAKVKVKSSSVTRVQAAAEFARKKARQRRNLLKRRVVLVAGVAVAAYAVVGGWWLYHTGKLAAASDMASASLWQLTADAGFRLDQIYLEGRTHADMATMKAALNVHQGEPILALPLADIKQRLLAVPEVKSVSITRALPNRLTIDVTERIPAAFWQHDGTQQLVDAEGVVLSRDKYKQSTGLPVIVGDDAPKHVGELLALLDSAPALKPDVVAAVRVGNRRWNIQLTRDIVVMLPEDAPLAAWKRFAVLVDSQALLTKAIRSVDMRMEDRVFIMPAEEKKSPITLTNARDT
jgi:cell division protein FtsQ